jgi:hypothetical protein
MVAGTNTLLNADHLDLRRLVELYALYADMRDATAYAALFLPDGRLTNRRPGQPEIVRVGSEELKTSFLFADPPLYREMLHTVENQRCEIAGLTATGETYSIAHYLVGEDDDDLQVHVAYVRYDDEYARTADGWRFASRILNYLWTEIRPAGRESASVRLLAKREVPKS